LTLFFGTVLSKQIKEEKRGTLPFNYLSLSMVKHPEQAERVI